MINATAYIVNQNGVITDHDGNRLNNFLEFKAACNYVQSFITNVRGKTYTDDWIVMGKNRIYTVIA